MDVSARPNLLWRLFVIAGVGSSVAVTVSDDAWEKWKGTFGETIPRETFKSFVTGTAGLHAAEATFAYASARRAGLDRPARRWALSTLLWGFPTLRRLRKAKKAAAVDAG